MSEIQSSPNTENSTRLRQTILPGGVLGVEPMEDLNKVTIVSVLPWEVKNEFKPGVYPSYYTIPAADEKYGFATLAIGPGKAYTYLDENRGSLPRRIPPEEIAAAVIRDYCHAKQCFTPDAGPGMFYLRGTPKKSEIKRDYSEVLENMVARQNLWFEALAKIADDEWAKFRQHKLISMDQRRAAEALNYSPEWAIDVKSSAAWVKCGLCRVKIPNDAIVCPNCHTVLNKAAFEAITGKK